MDILLIGGFLGGGKTTVLNGLLREMDGLGLTAAVIENEIGTTGIDDKTLSGAGVHITPLFGGCVCCQISGVFLDAVKAIEDTLHPDWVLVELTGLALMEDMRAAFEDYDGPPPAVHTLAVADAARWPVLVRACETVIRSQLGDADVVLLNKTDIAPPTEETLAQISAYCPGAPVLPIAAPGETGLWRRLEAVWKGGTV